MSALASGQRPLSGGRAHARRPDPATIAFLALLVLGALIVLVETRGLSFFGDDWDFLLRRRGMSPNVLLTPHGPHLSLVPILIYKAIQHVFGMSSYLPYRVLAAFDLVIMAAVLGVVCRARWGGWWGLAPVLLLVTLGPGSITTLWPFQVGYALATAAGVLALLALTRDDRRADLAACGLLVLSLASASQGIGFLAGAIVILALAPRWRSRAWAVLVPAVLYALWYLAYGHQHSESHLGLWKTSLSYSAQALSATLAPLLGLSSVQPSTGALDITFGVPLAIAAVALLILTCARGRRFSPLFWGSVATLVVLWVAASLSNLIGARPPNEPRYLVPDALLVLILLCDSVVRPRLPRRGVIAVLVALFVIACTNTAQYDQTRRFMRASNTVSMAEIGAVNLMRGVVPASYSPEQPGDPGVVVDVTAGSLLSAEDAFGALGDTPDALLRQSEDTRERADRVLAQGEGLTLSARAPGAATSLGPTAPAPVSGAATPHGACTTIGAGTPVVRLTPGRYLITARTAQVNVGVARFGSNFVVGLGAVPPRTRALLRIPADRAAGVPWRLQVGGAGGQVCSLVG